MKEKWKLKLNKIELHLIRNRNKVELKQIQLNYFFLLAYGILELLKFLLRTRILANF